MTTEETLPETKKPKRRGPKPQRTKIDMPWEEAVEQAIKTPRPPGGWPKPEPKQKAADEAE